MNNYKQVEKQIPQELYATLFSIAELEGIQGEEERILRAIYLYDFSLRSKYFLAVEKKKTIQFLPAGIQDDDGEYQHGPA